MFQKSFCLSLTQLLNQALILLYSKSLYNSPEIFKPGGVMMKVQHNIKIVALHNIEQFLFEKILGVSFFAIYTQ